jgi:hypothetical protein
VISLKLIFSFEKWAAVDSIFVGISSFLYAYSFIVLSQSDPESGALYSALFLLLTGLFSVKVMVHLYHRLRHLDEAWAFWAMIFAVVGAFGAAIHGGYDLANAINPPLENAPSLANLPSQIDPRGLLTFGAAGIGLGTFSWLITKSKDLPKNLGLLGALCATLMIVLYLGRLIVLSPADPIIVYPALANGFVLGPLFYIWLGSVLLKKNR